MSTYLKTADAAVMASMEELYFSPTRVAKVKDLLFRLTLNVVPHIPPEKVIWYDGAIESVALLTYYISQIEDSQLDWGLNRRPTSAAHRARVAVAIDQFLEQFTTLSARPDAEIANIERHINYMLQAANRWGEDDQVQFFWADHGETMEFLNGWLFELQLYLETVDVD